MLTVAPADVKGQLLESVWSACLQEDFAKVKREYPSSDKFMGDRESRLYYKSPHVRMGSLYVPCHALISHIRERVLDL